MRKADESVFDSLDSLSEEDAGRDTHSIQIGAGTSLEAQIESAVSSVSTAPVVERRQVKRVVGARTASKQIK
jgi:hypothetical protein